jgi:hypothetical protein
MTKEELKSQIHYIPGFMPADVIEIIDAYSRKNDGEFDEYGNGEKEFTVNVFKKDDVDTQAVRALVTEWGKKVYDFVVEHYGGEFKPFEPAMSHIARFESGWGMHEHYDASKPNDIATLIYINNDYTGGDIYFPEYDISHKPQPGDLLTFPDNPRYIHGVKPIAEGIRYTTPRWFTRIV